VVGYVWRPWGIHIDIVRDRGSKGMDRCPLTDGYVDQNSIGSLLWLLTLIVDNLNITQTPECSKGKYNAKIRE
jgi:hypothetical protein